MSLVSLATLAPAPDVARLTGLLERLVEIDTQNPPGREVEAAALLASELEAVGFVTEVRPVGDGRANVVGRIDNGEGPCFAFNSHMDTVPVGGGWTSDPFRLTERDGKLFGRGACDAKGPIVAMAEAGRLLALQRDHWRGTLIMMFVADEEINGGGSRALAKQAANARPDRYRRANQQRRLLPRTKGVCGRLSAPRARPRIPAARSLA